MKRKGTLTKTWSVSVKLFAVCTLLVWGQDSLRGQGWQYEFGDNKTDEGQVVLQTQDEGYLAVGQSESFGSDNDPDIYLVRTDVDGRMIWSQVYDEGFRERPGNMIETGDGNYLIVGDIEVEAGDDKDIYLLKLDQNGRKIWSRIIEGPGDEVANDVVPGADGGFLIVGRTRALDSNQSDILCVKITTEGEVMWQKSYGTPKDDVGNAVTVLNGQYIVVGNSKNPNRFDNDIIIYWLDENGEELNQNRISNSYREEANDVITTQDGHFVIVGLIQDRTDAFIAKYDAGGIQRWFQAVGDPNGEEVAEAVTEKPDGSLVLTGTALPDGEISPDILVARFDAGGAKKWERYLGDKENSDFGLGIASTRDGGSIIIGYNALSLSFFNNLLLVKIDGEGNTTSNIIRGQVVYDQNLDCEIQAGERGLDGWIIEVIGEDQKYYGTTDSLGNYSILVDTGAYHVQVLPISPYWTPCDTGFQIELSNFYDTTRLDFPVNAGSACPLLEVDITTPFLTACDNTVYTVEYCNLGAAIAASAYVEVAFDSELTFQSADLPATDLGENVYRFNLGDVAIGDCGNFQVIMKMACEGYAQNQAIKATANIFPDTVCLEPDPNWDRSSLEVEGNCADNQVQFLIRNVGKEPMRKAQRTIVTQDIVLFKEFDIELEAGQDTLIAIDGMGETYRLIASQPEGHPGRSFPTVAVEGCAEESEGNISRGYIAMYPENDLDPNISIDIQEVGDAVPGIALRGYPKGLPGTDGNRLVSNETDLKFTLLYQNLSEDTLDRVVIRDTLSPYLAETLLELGASSHPYEYELYGDGILKITFDQIQLPPYDSTAPTPLFVEYRVPLRDTLPAGTIIESRATIYVTNDRPRETNTLRYMVGGNDYKDFLEVVTSQDEVYVEGVEIKVFPNPFSESVTFEFFGNRSFEQLELKIFNVNGQLIDYHQEFGNRVQYYRSNKLATGMYFYRLESEGVLINSGKLLVR